MSIGSYPSIFNLGHKAIADLFLDPVVIQEKVDGSQFSFGVFDGEVHCRSKGKEILPDAPEKMFAKAVEVVKELAVQLHNGWTYRGEYLQSATHNTAKYSRIPVQHIMLFDIDGGLHAYHEPSLVADEAKSLGLEAVPTFYEGKVESFAAFMELVNQESVLGGCRMEGVVVKNYHRFGEDKKPLMGKYVRPEFKEENRAAWRVSNPMQGDVIQQIILTYRTEARWRKALQHLRDEGKLEGSPRDIGLLIKEVPNDVRKECEPEILETFWKYAWPKVERGLRAGLPEWYKEQLAKSAFGKA